MSARLQQALTYSACDSRVYEYLLPSYCLLPPASNDAICKLLNASSPGWRDNLGPGAAFADEAPDMTESAEGEGLRGWRVDEGTLGRFRALIDQFHGSQCVFFFTLVPADLVGRGPSPAGAANAAMRKW